MIKLENVTCSYDKVIWEKVNLTISPNKITFIIGKNGSGKSTFAHVLTGLKKDFSGNIFIDDATIDKKISIKEMRKLIGLVFQNPDNQILFNRVYDDLKFTLENMGVNPLEIDNRIKEVLKEVNMEEQIFANPYLLSGGQKQKLAIASVLLLKPKYIVFDEATSMLDINGKKEIYEIIEKLKQNHIGVIFITNHLEELIYADEILILDEGKFYSYAKKDLLQHLDILTKHGFAIPFLLKIIEELKNKGIDALSEQEILKEISLL